MALNNEGDIQEFNYTGNIQSIRISKNGIYKLEVYGAQGGNATSGYPGGKGGYSVGYKRLKQGDMLYICVGGQGIGGQGGGSTKTGGYNGGGTAPIGGSQLYLAGGGGATHIATVSGLIKDIGKTSFDNNGLIVAGGGGGGYYHTSGSPYCGKGGYGGGSSGGNGTGQNAYGTGGTQTAAGGPQAGGFGYGGNAGSDFHGSAGGGGYYGGGGSNAISGSSNSSGGGGSGWIGGVPSFTEEGIQYASTTTADQRTGNGYAKITLIKMDKIGVYIKVNNEWKAAYN